MRLVRFSIENYRSIHKASDIRIEPLQAFVGENNVGKSNILGAIRCFLEVGAGGMDPSDFNDQDKPVVLEAEFAGLGKAERKRLRSYLIGDRLIIQKQIRATQDGKSGKKKLTAEYHGYQAEPEAWFLSIEKIEAKEAKPDWKKIAEDHGLLGYAQTPDGKVNKTSYAKGLDKFLTEHDDVPYDTPELGKTKALGLQQNLLSALPEFFLLPAITDYSDEIDRRSSSTVFRRLMAHLSDRIMRLDERYKEIEAALGTVRQLLNPSTGADGPKRLGALGEVETSLADAIRRLMPSTKAVQLAVDIDEPKDIFSKGVSIRVDDGVITDVLDKGHGMQRSIVFALLQLLMKATGPADDAKGLILGIEEPELYIHPHAQRLIYAAMRDFAGFHAVDDITAELEPTGSDQVLYTTHSPAFIDIARYERVAVVRKHVVSGTTVNQCSRGVLPSATDRKGFKLLTCFGLRHNELFFARDCILVEGPEDEVGIIATARKLGRIVELPDEIGLSVVVADGKGDIPKFQKVLNGFGIRYGVLLEMDGKPETHEQTVPILENLNGNRIAKVPKRIEDLLGVGKHFEDQRHAKQFFSDPANINAAMEEIVKTLLPEAPGVT